MLKSNNQTITKSDNSHFGFTLIELLVVVGMIALITGALSTSISAGMQRARIQKATSEVKMLTQAIHSYANYNKGELEPIAKWESADFRKTLKFLDGRSGADIPVLIQAAVSQGVMLDPWGQAYQVKITKGSVYSPSVANLESGYYLPNFYRLSEDERQ